MKIHTWAPFSRSLRALTADMNPPLPLVPTGMTGWAGADEGVVDWAFKLETVYWKKQIINYDEL